MKKKKRQREVDEAIVLGVVVGAIAGGAWLVQRVVTSWPAPIEIRDGAAAFIIAFAPLIVSIVFLEVRRARREQKKRGAP